MMRIQGTLLLAVACGSVSAFQTCQPSALGWSKAPSCTRGLGSRARSESSILSLKASEPQDVGRRAVLAGAAQLLFSSAAAAQQIGWGEAQKAAVPWDGGFANPLKSQPNDFSAEVVNKKGTAVFISFVKPKKWKVSTNTGIAINDYESADGAFVLVAPAPEGVSDATTLDPDYVLEKIFDIKGRYGTFGKIDNRKVTKAKSETEGNYVYKYIDFKFAALSPGGRDIERNGCLKATVVDGDVIMFLSSTTSNRWNKMKETIAGTITSFTAIPAPKTNLKGGEIDSGIGNKAALGVAGYDLLRYDSPVWSN